MQLDLTQSELALKIVYYGPALGGKTTNLGSLRGLLPQGSAGRLLTLETRDDRTLFLDLLPVVFAMPNAWRVRVRVITVPGQIMHEATRRLLIGGADGVVFIADSQRSETRANNASFGELRRLLDDDVPLVVQFNKRDLPDIRTARELQAIGRSRSTPVIEAVALNSVGVRETFAMLLRLIWRRLDPLHHLHTLLGVDEDGFVASLIKREPE